MIKPGDKIGRVKIIDVVWPRPYVIALCRCGKQFKSRLDNVQAGKIKSCGCLKRDRFKQWQIDQRSKWNLTEYLKPKRRKKQ